MSRLLQKHFSNLKNRSRFFFWGTNGKQEEWGCQGNRRWGGKFFPVNALWYSWLGQCWGAPVPPTVCQEQTNTPPHMILWQPLWSLWLTPDSYKSVSDAHSDNDFFFLNYALHSNGHNFDGCYFSFSYVIALWVSCVYVFCCPLQEIAWNRREAFTHRRVRTSEVLQSIGNWNDT